MTDHNRTLAPFRRHSSALIVIGLIFLATLLRLSNIEAASLWYDEAISVLAAESTGAELLENTLQDPLAPLYYLILNAWFRLVPATDVTGRLLSTFLGLLLIPMGYLLSVDLLRQERLGLLVALLITISPFHILYSQELRMYTLLMLLATLAAFAYLRARRSTDLRWWLFFALSSLAAVYTHLFSAFLLGAVGIHALIRYRARRALRNTVLVGLFLIAAFTPWIVLVATAAEREVGSLRPLLGSHQSAPINPILPITAPTFLIFGHSHSTWYSAIVLFLMLAFFAVALLEIPRVRRDGGLASRILLPLLVVLCTVGLPITVYFVRPFFLPERTMAVASPFLMILLAWGATRKGSPLPYLLYATIAVMAVGTVLYLSGEPLKPPYRTAVKFVERNREPGDVIIHTSDGSLLPALAYVDFPKHGLWAGDPDLRKPSSVYEGLGIEFWTREQVERVNTRLWLIVALEHSIEWQQAQQSYFSENFPLLRAFEVGGIQIFLYDLNADGAKGE